MPDDGGMSVITDHSSYLFQTDGWDNPKSETNFVLNDSTYKTSIIRERVPGFRKRACKFVIWKKCLVNEKNETVPRQFREQKELDEMCRSIILSDQLF